ncbi:non-ribosomal peptide synthetase [Massilia endophytica]|uniref:non-ribosomal peptide synthetase n=1 Tax=Massilia endophytica TaxID=2899220 RepID=UPI001E4AA241|nr:non-ribosomal peptide synthetase [Massilia endophytica]UGQ48158.1 amino acid adenylation domain-containing protein [Massilia endophytica]
MEPVSSAVEPRETQHQLTEAGRRLVLHTWNATSAELPRAPGIHRLFEAQVRRAPESIAIHGDTAQFSYRELNAAANGLAAILQKTVRPGGHVALLLERSAELIIAELAVLKCGAVYVPLDPATPAERLAFLLADSGACALIVDSSVEAPLPEGAARIDIDRLAWTPQEENLAVDASDDTPAYVMYTSGSTGQAKGVVVQHGAIVRLVFENGYTHFSPTDRVGFAANPAFDATTMEVWAPLLTGGSVVVIPRETFLDDQLFAKALARHQVSVLFITTAVFNHYAACMPEVLGRLRVLLTGGERADPQAFAAVLAASPALELVHCYGPTETTTFAIAHRVTAIAPGATSVPLGRPIGNTTVYVLDSGGQPVPPGVPGELYIGGRGVALGYLNRPELSAERFVPDPFAQAPAKMYRTGDICRWREDGMIDFVGRNDFQVKIRGFRIEPGEIEAWLIRHPAVQEAVVVPREDRAGGKYLAAYYLAPQDNPGPDALRAMLAETLPEYMLPAAYVRLQHWPLTPNGKLDRKALPQPEAGDLVTGAAYEAPRTAAELMVASVWAEVLRRDRIGAADHFFSLGGHSLLGVQVVSRLRRAGMAVTLAELFARPVLRDFAAALPAGQQAAAPELQAFAGAVPVPSLAQSAMWLLDQVEGGRAYHIPCNIELRGALDATGLRRSLDSICRRHAALRSTFHQTAEGVAVRVAPAGDYAFALVESPAAGDIETLLEEELSRPFDLARGPLFRGRLLRLGAEHQLLLLTMHHIVSDGWSLANLLEELRVLYTGYVRDGSPALPPSGLQYYDYAAWQRHALDDESRARHIAYWRSALADAPVLIELPVDRPRPAVQDRSGAFLPFELEAQATGALKALAARHGVSLYMVLLAGWALLLARLAAQDEVVIGSPTAGRSEPALESMIGCFINPLALRIDLAGQRTLAALLQHVRHQVLAAQEHEALPFDQVVEALNPPRDPGHSPLFQVMFTWHNTPPVSLSLPGLQTTVLETQQSVVAKFDLLFSLREQAGGIGGGIEYATALFEGGTVARCLEQFKVLLDAMAADGAEAPARLAWLSAGQRQQVLEQWNATEKAYPRDVLAHQLFEQQAARTPDAVAAVFEESQLSYRELNERANRLAHHLRAQGVGPDVRAGILAGRSLEMVVAVLAVLKAGGAYVPLDPAYPADRLAYMVADSAPAVLLAQSALQELAMGMADGVPVCLLDGDMAWAGQSAANPPADAVGLTPQHLCYLIYTSGSTGMPKGVMIEHAGLCNYLHWALGAYAPVNAVVSSSLSFDATVTSLYLPLLRGGMVRLLREHDEIDGLYALLQQPGADWLVKATPAHLDVLGHRAKREGARTAVGVFVIGGEALAPSTVQLWREVQPGVRMVNEYGPTETVVGCVTYEVPEALESQHAVPIGQPIANTRIYILDAEGQPVPPGVSGELFIGTVGVARGYLNREELNAERFLPDPFSAAPGARMYRTGDLGRWRGDGSIDYLGRNDFQVKIRGFRIEPGEIEAWLKSHALVRDAAVIAREDSPGDKRLVAYYTAGAAVPAEELRAMLAQSLPEHMVPAAYVQLEELPLTPNGKLDRRTLPMPEAQAFAAHAYEAPQGELEAALARIWSEVLLIERVGRNDNFFELGGNSLLAVLMASRLRDALGAEARLADLFGHPQLAAFAATLAPGGAKGEAPLARAPEEERRSLSFAQQRLWFLAQMEGGSKAYHVPLALRLHGKLDTAALRHALNRIVARHEALRCSFHEQQGHPVLRIEEHAAFTLAQHDLRAHAQPQSELQRLLREEADAPFALETGPLIRGRLVQLAEDDHVLMITLHHIVSDGWSLTLLVRELNALYGAFAAGQADPLPPLPLQYADYAAWQRRLLQGETLETQVSYWRQALDGAPALLELPLDRPRPAEQSYHGAFVDFELDEATTRGLKALSARHGTTLFMTLLAGWSVLLARLSGQDDVVVGTPVAGRSRTGIENLIGFFVNMLPLRLDLSAEQSVAELLRQVRERTLAAQQHQELPFERMVEAVAPQRSAAYSPLFQAMFAWQNTPARELALPGLTQLPLAGARHQMAKFDLTLSLEEQGGRIAGGLEYATALFERSTIERFLEHLRTLLAAFAADAAGSIGTLPVLSGPQREQVLAGWNATASPYPRELCMHMLFEVQAQRTPDAVALSDAGGAVSYAELNRRANRLAHYLRTLGVGPDSRVALCLERGADMVASLLAVHKAGGAYVPLDPQSPPERLAQTLADCAPVALVTRSGLAQEYRAGVRVELDALREALAAQSSEDPAAPAGLNGGSACYVIYTSGSTGLPKGVEITHANLMHAMHARWKYYGHDAPQILQLASYTFDISVAGCCWALAIGGTLHHLEGSRRDPVDVVARMNEWRISHVMCASSLYAQLLEQAQRCGGLPHLRVVAVGGETCTPSLLALHDAVAPEAVLHNEYGPTEASIWATVHRHRRGRPTAPLGRPVANTRIYVLDAFGEPAAPGVAGEIHIGGGGVARGYLARPELNAERFLPDPFAQTPGARMYRTGDLGRWNADGTLEFCGRDDGQVKIRGFRVELGEIEARLALHPAVRDAAVLARTGAGGQQTLVAYYVAAEEEPGTAVLRAHLGAALPEHMVPAAFVPLAAMPLTPNGKLDRKALPAPGAGHIAVHAYVAPQGGMECLVASVWSEVLGLERIGRDDNFFALGGHSLLAVRAVSRLRDRLGADIRLGDLFAQPVLAAFAATLPQAGSAPLPAIAPAAAAERTALSFAQQRLWFLAQMDGVSGAYHIPFGLRLAGRLDAAALQQALDRIVARHESLRTCFVQADGQPAQRIAPRAAFALVHAELPAATQAAIARQVEEEAAAPFDIENGPLIRGRLLRVAQEEHVLLLTMHHIVSDGWSMGLLVKELSAQYAACLEGRPDPLPPLPVQYADFAAWQRRCLQGDVLQSQAAYWEAALAGAPALLDLPLDRPRPAQQDYRGGFVPFALDADATCALKELAARHGVTLFMALLAGWAALLSRLSSQQDIVIGTPAAGRGRTELEGLIGFFVNMLALRLDLSGNPDVAGLLAQVRERALAAQQHQDIPFEQVVEIARPVRSMAHSPVFQVMFAWQNTPAGEAVLPGLSLLPLAGPQERMAKFDLTLALEEKDGAICGGLEYASALFERATVERHLGQLRVLLAAMAVADGQGVDCLPVLSGPQRAQLLQQWNPPATAFPREACMHTLVEAQAARTPDAVAVLAGDESLSYAELNARANRLARHLRSAGVTPDARVAICMERGLDMIAGLLAVLKAGGAYVPLDPQYPPDRLAYMLEDSAPVAVLTQDHLAGLVAGAGSGTAIVRLDRDQAMWTGQDSGNLPGGAAPGHLAYIIYTSGSTGMPKGVAIEHRNAVNFIAWGMQSFTPEQTACTLLATSLNFDLAVFEIFVPLAAGSRVRVVRDALAIAAAPADGTLINTVPSAIAALLDMKGVPATVKTVNLAGEPLKRQLVERIFAETQVDTVCNLYGPSETTTYSTWVRMPREKGFAAHIGAPVANTQVYILNQAGLLQPPGAAGEIFIGGEGVARGYLNRPEMTAERFLPDPFAGGGSRMYRTGDLGRRLPDGSIEYLGRNDFQVKIRGFRIELGEVEARMLAFPGVRDAAVLAREDAAGEKQLVAYFTSVPGQAVTAEALRASLAAQLLPQMVPSAFVALDMLPLTPNGKLDRKALPAPDAAAGAARSYEAPQGDMEQALADIWAAVLNVERVGRHDNFFDIGGHSLLAARVVTQIRESLDVDIALRDAFTYPVLADFADQIIIAQLAQFETADLDELVQLLGQ